MQLSKLFYLYFSNIITNIIANDITNVLEDSQFDDNDIHIFELGATRG